MVVRLNLLRIPVTRANIIPQSFRSPSNYEVIGNVERPALEDLSFKELKTILEHNRFNSIEQVLEYLHENKPEYMSRYTLGYNSLSLHGSSKTHPRAIVYGKSGFFIITFNGHRDQDAYDKLETVEFNSHTNKFEFREIQFNELGLLGADLPFRISKVGGPENKCLQCHTNSRPIWEAYPVWPGLYGADDDQPIGVSARGNSLRISASKQVETDWRDFVEKYGKDGRYKYLRPLAKSQVAPGTFRPNTDLTILLYQRNFKRIGQIMKDHVDPAFRYAYLYASQCVPRIIFENAEIRPRNKWLPDDQKKPEIQYPRSMENLIKVYKPKYTQATFDHQVSKASRLMDDLYIHRR